MEIEIRNATIIKLAAILILGFGSLFSGMLPLMMKKLRIRIMEDQDSGSHNHATDHCVGHSHAPSQGRLSSFFICFGGGVILYTALIHMLPEVRESIEKLDIKWGHLPVCELLFVIGFTVVFVVEDVVHAILSRNTKDCQEDPVHGAVSLHCQEPEMPRFTTAAYGLTGSRLSLRSTNSCCHDTPTVTISVDSGVTNGNPSPTQDTTSSRGSAVRSIVDAKVNNSLRGMVTIMALSFHAIFEGLAVGLNKYPGSTLNLAIAIATHKFVIAFCVGMDMVNAKMSAKRIFYSSFIFSVVSPIGIIIGMVSKMANDGETATSAFLQAMAAGTLIYVVFFEILVRERAANDHKVAQFLGLMIGFALMLGASLIRPHVHNEDDHHVHEH